MHKIISAMTQKSGLESRIDSFESLRGVATLLVIMFHAPGWNSGKEYVNFIANGYLMVDLFFVLSGFVIFRAYNSKLNTFEEVKRFELLRFWRLYPVHLFYFLFFLITTATPFWQTHWDAFFEQIFLLQAIGPTGNAITFNYPAWTISVEFYTYLIFALVAWLMPKKRVAIYLGLMTFALICSWTGSTFGFGDILRCWSGFFMGCLCAAYSCQTHSKWPNWSSSAALISIAIFLQYKPSSKWDCVIYVLSAVLILSIFLSGNGAAKKILHLPPLIWLGKISYSLYMCQLAVIYLNTEFIFRAWGSLPVARAMEKYWEISFLVPHTPFEIIFRYLIFFLCLLIIGWLTFILIERPIRSWSRNQMNIGRLKS